MDDSVSEFIVRTCRLIPKSNTNVFDSLHLQVAVPLEHYQITCGSSAELFVQPIRSCIGDADVFRIKTKLLAFTDKKPEFPYEVRHNAEIIDCFLIEPYLDYPSFVRLRSLGKLRFKWESRNFEFAQIDVQAVATSENLFESERDKKDKNDKLWFKTGPARKITSSKSGSFSSLDIVIAMWCPQWPNEAKDWPYRQRKNNWPTTVQIQEVVQNGCLVVEANHPACRSDIHQCRISFTVAELILVQSWTKVQQIVYHMLRFFAKRLLIRKDCPKEDEVLCTYHLKTLMLWSCEEMSPEWWNSLSVIKICSNLLQKLTKWLKETSCPNYFIPQANLFHKRFNRHIFTVTVNILAYYSDSLSLTLWFMVNYIHPGFRDVLQDVIAANRIHDLTICVYEHLLQTCETMKADDPKTIDSCVSKMLNDFVKAACEEVRMGSEIQSAVFWKNMLMIGIASENKSNFPPFAEIQSSFSSYDSMLGLLFSVNSLDCDEVHCRREWFVELIRQISIKPKFVICRHHNIPRSLNTGVNEGQCLFRKAQELMENLTGSNDDLEFKVVSEISKALLVQAFNSEDSSRNKIEGATLAYAAALHFAASEYEIAIYLCSVIIMIEKNENGETETLNAGCLLYIDDIIKGIGFNRIFKNATEASLQHAEREQIFLDLRLKPEVFAYYLITLSTEISDCSFELEHISQSPKFPLDAILIAIANRISSRRLKKRVLRVYEITNPNEGSLTNKDNIIQLLLEFSLEKMTSFYDLIARDFDIHCSTVDCYRAAYLYICRKYPEVLHLCEKILKEIDLQSGLKELAISNVMLVPPLDTFFDRDIQCSLGLHTLVCYLSSSIEDLTEGIASEMLFPRCFTKVIKSSDSSMKHLSSFLFAPYSVKCHYFLGRHFLARYLKARCLIDCNCSLLEIMQEFEQLKACLPFERFIRCFLKAKLANIAKHR